MDSYKFSDNVNEEKDIAYGWLKALSPEELANSPLAEAFRTFSETLLLVGVGLLAWWTIAAMVNSAHEGKVLGSRAHLIWSPIRVALGIGFLAPIAGGFNAAQILIWELAKLGSMMATVVWAQFAAAALTDGKLMPSPVPANGAPIAEAFLEATFCTGALNAVGLRVAELSGEPAPAGKWVGGYGYPTLPDAKPRVINSVNPMSQYLESFGISSKEYRDLIGKIEDYGSVGSRDFDWWLDQYTQRYRDAVVGRGNTWDGTIPPDATNDDLRKFIILTHYNLDKTDTFRKGVVWDFGICGEVFLENDSSTPEEKQLFDAQVDAMSRMYQAMTRWENPVMQNVVRQVVHNIREEDPAVMARIEARELFPRDVPVGVVNWVNQLATAYDRSMLEAASKYANSLDATKLDELAQQAADLGWMAAGHYYLTLSSITSRATEFTGRQPNVKGINFEMIGRAEGGDGYVNMLRETKVAWADAVKRASREIDLAAFEIRSFDENEKEFPEFMRKSLTDLAQGVVGSFTSYGRDTDPMTYVINVGNSLIKASAQMIAGAMLGGVVLSNVFSAAAGGLGAFLLMSPIVLTAAGLTYFAGLVLVYVIPVIPFIMLTLLAFGWLIMIAEAMIAVIVYVFFYIRMDGQELFDNPHKPGLMLMLNIFLRPTLGIIAFMITFYLLPLVYEYLSRFFVSAFFAQQAGKTVFVGGMITAMVIYVYLTWMLTMRLFQLTADMPDRIGRWFGVSAENLGESQDMSRSTATFLHLGQRAVGGGVGSLAAGARKISQPKPKPKNDEAGGGGNPNK